MEDRQKSGLDAAGDRAAMARYASMARLWAREASARGDAEGLERSAELAMLGCALRPMSKEARASETGFEGRESEALAFIEEAHGAESHARGLGEQGAQQLIEWGAKEAAPASFAAAALARALKARLDPEFWARMEPQSRVLAEKVRLCEPAWAKELARRAGAREAHGLAQELGGPSKDVGERLGALAKALVSSRAGDAMGAAKAREEVEALLASAPQALQDKAPLRAGGAGDDARDPLNWGCDDQTAALALRLARQGRLRLTLAQRGKSDMLALGMIFIHGGMREALGELLGLMREREAPLDGRLGERQHLNEHATRWKIDAGKRLGRKPFSLPAQSLFEAALLKGADWAKSALLEAGHRPPKMASVDKWIEEWKSRVKLGAGRETQEDRLQTLAALRSEHEAWCLEAATVSAQPLQAPRAGSRGPRV